VSFQDIQSCWWILFDLLHTICCNWAFVAQFWTSLSLLAYHFGFSLLQGVSHNKPNSILPLNAAKRSSFIDLKNAESSWSGHLQARMEVFFQTSRSSSILLLLFQSPFSLHWNAAQLAVLIKKC
jgi:hypothetical protein